MFRPDFSTAKDARVVKSRDALCKALLDLLKTEPFERISVRQIVDHAGVGYNTFFRHYADRDAILRDIAAEEIRQLVSLSVPVLDAENTLAACMSVCQHVAENKALWRTLLTGGASATLREEFIKLSRNVAESRANEKDWLPLDAAVILITSGTFELLAWWLGSDDPVPVEQLATIYQRAIVSPVIDP
jgi:AcrR family transcriptional regulator